MHSRHSLVRTCSLAWNQGHRGALGAVGGTTSRHGGAPAFAGGDTGSPRYVPRVSETPFERLHHLVTVPVTVDDRHDARFVLDTGIGVTLFSRRLCAAVGCHENGSTFTGRRMSGQEITVQLADAPPLAMGGVTRRDHVIGILDLDGDGSLLATVDGFLSLAFFETTPFTVDYARGAVVIEQPPALERRVRDGFTVPVRVERNGPAIDAFMRLDVPGGTTVEVEIDRGATA